MKAAEIKEAKARGKKEWSTKRLCHFQRTQPSDHCEDTEDHSKKMRDTTSANQKARTKSWTCEEKRGSS